MASNLAQFMAQATRAAGTPSQPSPSQQKTANVHALYKRGLQQLRGDRNMHPDRKKVEAARLYATTRDTLQQLRQQQKEADEKAYPQLERKLWGHDLERATAVDRASLDATIRDAGDRAAALKRQEDAQRALAQAEQNGDHILARAIGKRAHDMDWDDVLADYFHTRPSAAQTYQQLGEIWHRAHGTGASSVIGRMQYDVGKPEEIRGMSDDDIAALAADPADNAA